MMKQVATFSSSVYVGSWSNQTDRSAALLSVSYRALRTAGVPSWHSLHAAQPWHCATFRKNCRNSADPWRRAALHANPKGFFIFRRTRKTCESRLESVSRPPVCPYVYVSLRANGKTRLPLGGFWWNSIFVFRKYVQKIKVSLKPDKNKGSLYNDPCTFMKISHSFPSRMRNFSNL